MSRVVHIVQERKLGVEHGKPVVAWEHIDVFSDRSKAYEYASKVEDHIDVIVREKEIIGDVEAEKNRVEELLEDSEENGGDKE